MDSNTYRDDIPDVGYVGGENNPKTSREKWWKTLRIELFMVIQVFGTYLGGAARSSLYMNRVCMVNLNQTEEVCANITAYPDILDDAQRKANYLTTYNYVINIIPSLIVTIFAGSFSDKFGRKPIITFASIGRVGSAAYTLFLVYWTTLPVEYFLLASLPLGLTGGSIAYSSNIYCLLSDSSTTSTRTLRFAIYEVVKLTVAPVSTIIGGQVWKYFGYKWLFGSALVLDALALMFLVVFIKEKRENFTSYSWRTAFDGICNLDSLKENFRVCLKKRENQGRTQIWMVFTAKLCLYIGKSGINHTMFFFVNKVYGWDVAQFTIVDNGFKFGNIFLAAAIGTFLTKVIKITDSCLALGSMFILTAQCIGMAFAYKTWIYYATSVFESVLPGICSTVLKSKISKVVGPDEQGKAFCVVAILEETLPSVGTYLFASIYNSTLDSFPGMVFLVASGFYIVPIGIFAWFVRYFDDKSHVYTQIESDEEIEEPTFVIS